MGARVAISLLGSQGVTVSSSTLNNNREWAVLLRDSNHNTITSLTADHNGLNNVDSDEVSGSFAVFLGQQSYGAMVFVNSDHNVLSYSQFSSDAYASFLLVGSDYNTIKYVNSMYPDYYGGVLQDSSYNTVDHTVITTSDYVGLVIRGGGFNTITHVFLAGNGPTGRELRALNVPYFTSGLYLGWGTHDNSIAHNTSNKGNTGPGLLVDPGSVLNPVQNPTQSLNPFNNANGNDPGTVPAGSAFDAGISTEAGWGNMFCGNSFATFSGVSNPNVSC